jgi:hypothetical protein
MPPGLNSALTRELSNYRIDKHVRTLDLEKNLSTETRYNRSPSAKIVPWSQLYVISGRLSENGIYRYRNIRMCRRVFTQVIIDLF